VATRSMPPLQGVAMTFPFMAGVSKTATAVGTAFLVFFLVCEGILFHDSLIYEGEAD
jgi:hypothetical protein